MDAIHRALAYGAVAVAVVGIGWSALIAAKGLEGTRSFERFQAAVVSLLIVASASGLLLLVTGSRPSESLHLLYAGVALAVIPLARSFLGRASRRRAGLLFLTAFVVLGAALYRLFTTG